MKVTGFSFIRNAIKYDYPIVEAIKSVLPICDNFIIALGNSEDNTEELIKNIGSDKIKIIHTTWNDSLREGGRALAIETDKAFDAISADTDWCFYIQGDEVIHEQYYENIKKAMLEFKDNPRVDGLLFKYLHFFGSYNYIGASRRWYRNEIRIIKNNKAIRSFKDAQGFRMRDGCKLNVKKIDAWVYHYGWVKEPAKQQKKAETFHKMWHDDEWVNKHIPKVEVFDYSFIDSLKPFTGIHPEVMKNRVAEMNWDFEFDTTKNNYSFKNKLLMAVEKVTGWRMGEYKNYKVV